MTRRTLIVVAGMHRSGTSLLAQVLHGLGGCLGEDLDRQPSPSNRSGHWEHSVAWRIMERLLDDLGQGWGAPAGPLPTRWSEWPEAAAARRALTGLARAHLAVSPNWVVKDPRATRCLPLWAAVAAELDADLRVVASLRSSSCVARSLAMRDGIDPDEARRLWLQYYGELMMFAQSTPVLLVNYDKLIADGSGEARRIARFCGLPDDPQTCERAAAAIRASLRNHAPEPGDPQAAEESVPAPDMVLANRPGARADLVRIYLETAWNEPFLLRAVKAVLAQQHTAWQLCLVASPNLFGLIREALAPYEPFLDGRLRLLASDEPDAELPLPTAAVATTEFDCWAPGFLDAALEALRHARHGAFVPMGEWTYALREANGLRVTAREPAVDLPGDWPCLAAWEDVATDARLTPATLLARLRATSASGAARVEGRLTARDDRVRPPSGPQRIELMAVGPLHVGSVLDARPATLPLRIVPGQHVESLDGFWLSRGEDPQLHFTLPDGGVRMGLPEGLYLLRFDAALVGSVETLRLYSRSDQHFSEAQSLDLPPSPDGAQAVLLNAPDGLEGLRLDQSDGTTSAMRLTRPTLLRLCSALPLLAPPRRAARFPDVLCIGAQKSATTWLHQNLQAVPGIWKCSIKEFHHFDSLGRNAEFEAWKQTTALELLSATEDPELRRLAVRLGFPAERGWDGYLDLFADAPADEMVIDATPAYATLDDLQVSSITRLMPHVKVLFILRDPVERSLSGAFHEARQRRLEPTAETLAALTREPGNIARSNYVATIDRWSRHLPAAQFRVLFYDDLLWDAEGFFDDACRFIGVTPGVDRAQLLTPVNQGAQETSSIDLSALRAELSFRWLPHLRVLAGRYDGPCVQWLASAESRIRANLDATHP